MEVTIAEGKNREIRRVTARIGHVVRDMNRVAIAGKLTIENLKIGTYRALTEQEIKWLYHASTQEFHGEKKAATQAWYESKEMEKERKRLLAEAEAAKAQPPQPKQAPGKTEAPDKIEFRPRPVRRGKRPFIPPTGRNAGKSLGGNFIGRKRLEQQRPPQDADAIADMKDEPRTIHPLGDAAQSDE